MADFENKNMFEGEPPPKSKKLKKAEKKYNRAHRKTEYARKKNVFYSMLTFCVGRTIIILLKMLKTIWLPLV